MKSIAAAVLLAAAPAVGAAGPTQPPAAPAGPAPTATPTPRPAAPETEQTARARAHFRKGSELYRQARYREAIAEFESAYKLRPHGVIYYNLAQCHERLGDIPSALQAYHEYLRAVPEAEDRATVHAAMANLEARLGASGVQQLLVYSDPSGAELLVDGQSKGRTPMALVLPHGSHSVTLLKQGHRTATRQVLLSPQASLELDVVLPRLEPGERIASPVPLPPPPILPAPSTGSASTGSAPAQAAAPAPGAPAGSITAPPPVKPPAAPPKGRLWTWVAAGAAVAAGGAGVYYAVKQRNTQNDFLAAKGDANNMLARSHEEARIRNVLFGAAGALGAGAGALFFLEGSF